MEWFSELLSSLGNGINFSNPISVGILFVVGLVSEIGFPLFFGLETFLFFISYDIGPFSSPALITILMLLLGRQCGAAVLYLISRLLGARFLDWLCRIFPRLSKGVERFRERLSGHQITAVTLIRLTPGLLQVPSISAGIMRLPYPQFAAGVAISSIAYDLILIIFGVIARTAFPQLPAKPKTLLIIGFVVIIVIVWTVIYFVQKNAQHQKGS